jgi:hypothetical protein
VGNGVLAHCVLQTYGVAHTIHVYGAITNKFDEWAKMQIYVIQTYGAINTKVDESYWIGVYGVAHGKIIKTHIAK